VKLSGLDWPRMGWFRNFGQLALSNEVLKEVKHAFILLLFRKRKKIKTRLL
jgi:hypothetical protein